MANRTGNVEIDELLDSFVKARISVRVDRRALAMPTPVKVVAAQPGMCQVLADKFEDWAARRVGEGWRVYASSLHSPDAHGYSDRTIEGFPNHSSSIIEAPDGTRYLIDWSASQYGYSELPLVQRSIDEGKTFQRDFDRPQLDSSPPAPAEAALDAGFGHEL